MSASSMKSSTLICRLCAQAIGTEFFKTNETIEVDNELQHLNYLISYCLDIDLTNDLENTSRIVCRECVERLKFVFTFKKVCHQNNESFFVCYPNVRESPEPGHADDDNFIAIKTEPYELNENEEVDLKEDALGISSGFTSPESHLGSETNEDFLKLPRKYDKESATVRCRQRRLEKRMKETPEERKMRLQKQTEESRLRRLRRKHNDPEAYASYLARQAALKKQKRQNMSEEEKAKIRARDLQKTRERRAKLPGKCKNLKPEFTELKLESS